MHHVPPHARSGRAGAATTLRDELARPAPSIVSLLDQLISDAHALGASDVHLDPNAEALLVRLRVDGVLEEFATIPKSLHAGVIARIKVLAGLRADEHYATQDGRFRFALPEGPLDVRVSLVPTYHGENAVLRFLGAGPVRSLAALGFGDGSARLLGDAAQAPSGLVLVCGLTGSGKTTTLHSLISLRTGGACAVLSLEDPIERTLPGVRQVEVNPRTGLTFANGLRAFVRQDPDVIMVGEIRDRETANLAISAALTGHLVLATLHTMDAVGALPRLAEMGVDPYLVSATVSLVAAQRLVRTVCSSCAVWRQLSLSERRALPVTLTQVRQVVGCDACRGRGYAGRTVIAEVLFAKGLPPELILNRAPRDEVRQYAQESGMVPLVEDGWRAVRTGLTTPEEVLRVLYA